MKKPKPKAKKDGASPALSVTPGSALCPNCGRHTTGGLFGHSNEPKDCHELAWTVTHCGCYHEPRGGERYTAERDAREYTITGSPSPECATAIREMVRLAALPNNSGQTRPAKPL